MVNGADVAVGEITVEAAVVMEGVLVVMEVVLVDIAGDSPGVVEVTKFLVLSPTVVVRDDAVGCQSRHGSGSCGSGRMSSNRLCNGRGRRNGCGTR